MKLFRVCSGVLVVDGLNTLAVKTKIHLTQSRLIENLTLATTHCKSLFVVVACEAQFVHKSIWNFVIN